MVKDVAGIGRLLHRTSGFELRRSSSDDVFPTTLDESDTALYNLRILLNEDSRWQGPFGSIDSFLHAQRQVEKIVPFLGTFTVHDSGMMVQGEKRGLHTYEAGIDMYQPEHIHFKWVANPNIADLSTDLCLTGGYKTSGPVYTLDGLYESLGTEKLGPRITALKNALRDHTGFTFRSISRSKKLRAKLLERHYRERISDQ